MMRSVLAVLAGFSAYGVVCISVNMATMKIFPQSFFTDGTTNSVPLNLFMLVMSFVYSVFAGYVAASVAKGDVIKPVWCLAIVNLVVGIGVQSQYWNTMPLWYHIPFLVLIIPFVLFGGKLRLLKVKDRV